MQSKIQFMSRFEYIIKKIETSRLKINPSKHVHTSNNFLKKNDYDELINNVPLDKIGIYLQKNKALRRKL